jgi:hypothetical protein
MTRTGGLFLERGAEEAGVRIKAAVELIGMGGGGRSWTAEVKRKGLKARNAWLRDTMGLMVTSTIRALSAMKMED